MTEEQLIASHKSVHHGNLHHELCPECQKENPGFGNVKLKDGFKQVCVWQGTTLDDHTGEELEAFIKSEFGVDAQFLEQIETYPDQDKKGRPVSGTGGRHDLLFSVKGDAKSFGSFCVKRFAYGIRWIEDVLAPCNYRSPIYPLRVFAYCSWGDCMSNPFEDDGVTPKEKS